MYYMKKIFSIVCGCIIMYSCNNEMEQTINEIKPYDTKAEISEISSDVTFDDIQAYIQKESPVASRNGKNGDIEIITYQNDTVMYLLNYANGWEMLPGDKRFPLRIAYNDEGTLDYANMNETKRMWFNNMAEKIYIMKKYGYNIENEYCKVWNRFSKKKKKYANSRTVIDGEGGWIYHNTRIETEISSYKNHLTTTLWHQTGVYNNYCPKIESNSIDQEPAGCVAVAGAQVIYYLQKLWGYPSPTPSTATYNEVENKYIFSNWNYSEWDFIESGDTNAIAKLIGNVGTLFNVVYDEANIIEHLPIAMNSYNIGHTKGNIEWPTDIIVSNLDRNLPVIGGLLYGNNIEGGHAVIIDGYKKVNTTYTDVYIHVEDPNSYPGDIYDHGESGDPVPEEGPTQTTSYTISDYYYLFNWGGDVISQDNTYYHADSSVPKLGDPNVIYRIKKQIMYNFHKK